MKKMFFRLFLLNLIFAFSIGASAQEPSKTQREAGERIARGDIAGAISVLDKAVERKKDLFDAYKMRSSLRSMLGDLDGAISDLSAALEVKPDAAELYRQRAFFRMFRRDTAGALKDFDQAIAHGLKSEKVYVGRGDIKRDTGDLDGAIADYQTAIGINPNYTSAYNGWSFALERRGETGAATVLLEEFLDRIERERDGKMPRVKAANPTVTGVLIEREGADAEGKKVIMQGQGSIRISAKTLEEMQKKQEALEENLSLASAYTSLGFLYNKKGDSDKALLNFGKTISIRSDDGYTRALRGKLRLKLNDVRGAIEDLSVAADAPSGAPDRHADKGILLILLGKDAEAQKEFDKHLQIFPTTKDFLDKRIEDAKQKRTQQ